MLTPASKQRIPGRRLGFCQKTATAETLLTRTSPMRGAPTQETVEPALPGHTHRPLEGVARSAVEVIHVNSGGP